MTDYSRFETFDGASWAPLNIYWEDADKVVVIFHDGVERLREFVDLFDFGKPLLVAFTCAWYVSPERAADYRAEIARALRGENRAGLREPAILFFANSDLEVENFRSAFPASMVARSNNAITLDERLFDIRTVPKYYDAVLNAKALRFKRHHLSETVPRKAFISYRPRDGSPNEIDIDGLGAERIFWSIDPAEVVDVLNAAHVGLALSATEGACWASLEYLLCGLPVVSTPSRGGRDDFYSEATALIAEPTRSDVAVAVRRAQAKLRRGEFEPAAIRRATLAKLQSLRAGFERVLSDFSERNGCGALPAGLLARYIAERSKLTHRWIYWPRGFRVRP